MDQWLAPMAPLWLMLEREAEMQIDKFILHSTVFLGTPLEHGFYAEGTAFYVSVPLEDEGVVFAYLVTCRHVVRPTVSRRDQTPNHDPIWVRSNRKGSQPPYVEKTLRSAWIPHPNPNVDVCVTPVDISRMLREGEIEFATLNTKEMIWSPEREKIFGISLGDSAFIVGCFIGRVGEKKNIPVVRIASIAAMPDEPLWGGAHLRPAYLIETRSLGGISGSPLFLHVQPERIPGGRPPPTYNERRKGKEVPYFLLGMMQGIHSGQYSEDFISEDDDERVVPKDADFNAGIGVAVPVDQIMEVINLPLLAEARMNALKAGRRLSGYKDASAPLRAAESSPPATDANPNHREDFTRLLSAAVKAPQSKE